jgi:hypothetical protein
MNSPWSYHQTFWLDADNPPLLLHALGRVLKEELKPPWTDGIVEENGVIRFATDRGKCALRLRRLAAERGELRLAARASAVAVDCHLSLRYSALTAALSSLFPVVGVLAVCLIGKRPPPPVHLVAGAWAFVITLLLVLHWAFAAASFGTFLRKCVKEARLRMEQGAARETNPPTR